MERVPTINLRCICPALARVSYGHAIVKFSYLHLHWASLERAEPLWPEIAVGCTAPQHNLDRISIIPWFRYPNIG